jgi:hypothetical protein
MDAPSIELMADFYTKPRKIQELNLRAVAAIQAARPKRKHFPNCANPE